MDRPDLVRKLITIDGLPVIEHLERADWQFARDWYHWFFFAQPVKPERAILVDPMAWYDALVEVAGETFRDIRPAATLIEVSRSMHEMVTESEHRFHDRLTTTLQR